MIKCSINLLFKARTPFIDFKGIGKIIIEGSKQRIDMLDLCFRKVFLTVVWKRFRGIKINSRKTIWGVCYNPPENKAF